MAYHMPTSPSSYNILTDQKGSVPGYAAYNPAPTMLEYQTSFAPTTYQNNFNNSTGPDYTGDFAASSFDDKTIRRKFISKVYAILTAQLLVTLAFVCICLFIVDVHFWVRENAWCYWLSYAIFLCSYIALACCSGVRRRFPGNFISLSIFTLALSYITGTISAYYNVNSVLTCLCLTACVTFLVSLAAVCCPCDITKCQAVIIFLSVLLLFFGLICIIVFLVSGYNSALHAVYGGVAAVIFSIYLAYDTQMIIGGKKHEISAEEYIFAALQLYLDIVNIFIMLLSVFGSSE